MDDQIPADVRVLATVAMATEIPADVALATEEPASIAIAYG